MRGDPDPDHDDNDQAELCVLLGVGPQHGVRVDDGSQSILLGEGNKVNKLSMEKNLQNKQERESGGPR